MSAAVNDRPHPGFSHVQPTHLPLTGELHPLRREFERWLATGHAITVLVALVVLSALALWDRAHVSVPGPPRPPRIIDPRIIDPPPIDPGRSNGPRSINAVVPPNAVPEPVDRPIDPDATIRTIRDFPGDSDIPEGPFTVGDSVVLAPPTPKEPWTGGWSDPPVLLAIEPPIYPEMVRDAGIDGTVTVKVLVGRNGRVKDAVVLDGSPALHAAALASVRTAVFKPALQGTEPVDAWVAIPVVFQLQGRW